MNRTSRGEIVEETQVVATADGPTPGNSPVPAVRVVVAVVLEWQHRIALFRRSSHLEHDGGRWHCITGFLEPGVTPLQQALQEINEETGLVSREILKLKAGPCVELDDWTGTTWLVHTFTALSARRRLQLNWEHDTYRWTPPAKVRRFSNQVSWLKIVLIATGYSTAQDIGSVIVSQPH